MNPKLVHNSGVVYEGNSVEVLKELESNSIDAVITDPPYEINIAGHEWDRSGIAYSIELWAECLRVLKPGGHLVAFTASKNYHRVATAVESSGFEVREMFTWIYSGFAKGVSVGIAIDRFIQAGSAYGVSPWRPMQLQFTTWLKSTGLTAKAINEATSSHMGSHYLTQGEQPQIPNPERWEVIKNLLSVPVPAEIEELVNSYQEVTKRAAAEKSEHTNAISLGPKKRGDAVEAVTEEGKAWEGWKTIIKSQQEPAVVARKPLEKHLTLAQNVLLHGTGAINAHAVKEETGKQVGTVVYTGEIDAPNGYFYHAKASKKERPVTEDGFQHSTVKPLSLMEYLIKAFTPEGGVVLDPFSGSGSTLEAAKLTGYRFVGVDITPRNLELIEQRLDRDDPRTC